MPGWKKSSENKILGKSYTRLDGPIKATGRAKYAYDINLPGLLYGRICRSKHANATIKSIDASPAERMPGVKVVIVSAKPGDTMRYQGQPIAALCATNSDIAEDAIRAIKIEYDVLPHAAQERVAIRPEAPKSMGASNLVKLREESRGDANKAFDEAAHVHEADYGVAVRAHLSLETHGTTCRWDDDTHLTCWASTQGVFTVRNDLANRFKLPMDNVHVITEVMGGGFGSKFGAQYDEVVCAELAQKAKAPVKLLLTRQEEHLAVGNAPSAFGRLRIAADKEGKLTAFDAHVYRGAGVNRENGPMPYIYHVPNFKVLQEAVITNSGPSRAWRAPNHPQSSFLMESALEDLAVKMGIDPLEMRKKNDPHPIRSRQWDDGAKLIGWERRNAKPGVGALAGNGRFRRGLGCGAATWFGGGGGGSSVKVTVNRDASVLVENGVQDIGTGTRTYTGAIVAEELGIPMSDVQVVIGHSTKGPGPASGGSQTAPSLAPAVKRAAEAAKTAMIEAVATRIGAPVEDVDLADGKVFSKSDSTKSMDFKAACRALPTAGVVGEGKFDRELTNQPRDVAGVQFAEVEVDTETGKVRPIKIVCLQDGGIVLNRLTYVSQLNGAIIQGIGMALYEDRHMCQLTGHQLNPNMEEYKIPGALEMPEFVCVPYEYPEAKGVSGIGEPPVIPTAAAIRNAILNATGAHVNEAPMTPQRVLEALAAARKRGNA